MPKPTMLESDYSNAVEAVITTILPLPHPLERLNMACAILAYVIIEDKWAHADAMAVLTKMLAANPLHVQS
jgi:hypothetical protein